MIALEVRAPALNRLRSWPLTGTCLAGGRAVVTFGRIGQHGPARRHAFEGEAGLSRFVRRALLRRRIGVSYEAVEASPSILPFLMQLGLAVRLPSAPTLERAVSEPIGVPLETRSIGDVEHTGA